MFERLVQLGSPDAAQPAGQTAPAPDLTISASYDYGCGVSMLTITEYKRRHQHVRDHGPNRLQVNIFLGGFALAGFIGLVGARKDVPIDDPVRSTEFYIGALLLSVSAVAFLITTLVQYRAINTLSDCDDAPGIVAALDAANTGPLEGLSIGRFTAAQLITRSYRMHHRVRLLMIAGIFLALASLWLYVFYINVTGGWILGGVFVVLALFYAFVGRLSVGGDS